MLSRFNSIIIDSNPDGRNRLKQAIAHSPEFDRSTMLSSLRDARCKLETPGTHECDLVFISYSFGRKDLAEFISQAKQLSSSKHAAFVLVIGTDHQGKLNLAAQNILDGADGVLLEPYSVDGIKQLVELARAAQQRRMEERELAVLDQLIPEIFVLLSEVSDRLADGEAPGKAVKHLRGVYEVLLRLSENTIKCYYELIIPKFIESKPPEQCEDEQRRKRAESRLARKLRAKLREQKLRDMEESIENTAQPAAGPRRIIKR